MSETERMKGNRTREMEKYKRRKILRKRRMRKMKSKSATKKE